MDWGVMLGALVGGALVLLGMWMNDRYSRK